MIFHDFTVLATGEIRSRRVHETDALEPAAVEWFSALLAEGGEDFRREVHPGIAPGLALWWTRKGPGRATATFLQGREPLNVSALLMGGDPEAERRHLRELQADIVSALWRAADPSFEPAGDILSLAERPLLATVPLCADPRLRDAVMMAADMSTCLAAAFFLAESSRG